LLPPRGALYFARAGQQQQLERVMRAAHSIIEVLSPKAARARVPSLRPDYAAGCLYELDAHDIDVASLLQGFSGRPGHPVCKCISVPNAAPCSGTARVGSCTYREKAFPHPSSSMARGRMSSPPPAAQSRSGCGHCAGPRRSSMHSYDAAVPGLFWCAGQGG
jgi:hypothetical protein